MENDRVNNRALTLRELPGLSGDAEKTSKNKKPIVQESFYPDEVLGDELNAELERNGHESYIISRAVNKLRWSGLLSKDGLDILCDNPISQWPQLLDITLNDHIRESPEDLKSPKIAVLRKVVQALIDIAYYHKPELRKTRQAIIEYTQNNNLINTPITLAYSDRPELLEIFQVLGKLSQEEFEASSSLVQFLSRNLISLSSIKSVELKKVKTDKSGTISSHHPSKYIITTSDNKEVRMTKAKDGQILQKYLTAKLSQCLKNLRSSNK